MAGSVNPPQVVYSRTSLVKKCSPNWVTWPHCLDDPQGLTPRSTKRQNRYILILVRIFIIISYQTWPHHIDDPKHDKRTLMPFKLVLNAASSIDDLQCYEEYKIIFLRFKQDFVVNEILSFFVKQLFSQQFYQELYTNAFL